MAYVSSSDPLPANSLNPGPPIIDMARVHRDFMDSRTGRERVYANSPTPASLWDLGPGLAVDANQLLGQSETARESVLTGLDLPATLQPDPTLAEVQASAPIVSSLNGSPGSGAGLDSSQNSVMPLSAPPHVYGGVYGSSKSSSQNGQAGVTTVQTARPGQAKRRANNQDGPGACGAGRSSSISRGAYGPDWGDTSGAALPGDGESRVSSWVLVGAGLAAIGLVGLLGKKGRF